MIISFAKTTGALLAGAKTVTRRDWSPKHAAKFKAGMVVDAWNTVPRNVRGNPHKVATIRLVEDPEYQFRRGAFPPDHPEFSAEGFAWMYEHGLALEVEEIQDSWANNWDEPQWVVRFEVVEYLEGPLA